MAAGPPDGTGATTNSGDAKRRKEESPAHDDEQTRTSQHKDGPGGRRSGSDNSAESVDRPGFDLGGSSGDTDAGRGLGLDEDAKEEGRDGFALPRKTTPLTPKR